MKKVKIIKIDFPIFKQGLFVCVGEREEAKKWFETRHISTHNFPKTSKAHTWTLDGFFPHIWFRDLKEIDVISHELIHACWFVLADKGIKITEDNHEALTYLQGYAFKNILRYRK